MLEPDQRGAGGRRRRCLEDLDLLCFALIARSTSRAIATILESRFGLSALLRRFGDATGFRDDLERVARRRCDGFGRGTWWRGWPHEGRRYAICRSRGLGLANETDLCW